jgi:hypothetical protein
VSTEYKGRVKPKIWLKATCADDGESVKMRRKARKDFREECRHAGIPFHLASPDEIQNANELGEPYGLEDFDA